MGVKRYVRYLNSADVEVVGQVQSLTVQYFIDQSYAGLDFPNISTQQKVPQAKRAQGANHNWPGADERAFLG